MKNTDVAAGPPLSPAPRSQEITARAANLLCRALADAGRKDLCLFATVALIDVLDHFRVHAAPLPVLAEVFNPEMSRRIEAEGMPTLEAAERDWFPRGCHLVGVGYGDPAPGHFDGHLVTIVEGEGLADLTLDQADRPAHGILLPVPVLVGGISPAFLAGEGVLSGHVGNCLVQYRAVPGRQHFRKGGDWHSRGRRSVLVGRVIRQLKREGIDR